MDIVIHPRKLQGELKAIPSKSHAHRALICAAFSDRTTTIVCPETNNDIEATVDCLRALGANILRNSNGYIVVPVACIPQTAILNCNESGSTLRFMLPVVGALGVDTVFQLAGRLPQRPLSPLWEEMERMGCNLVREKSGNLRCARRLRAGQYSIAGNVSSQFISGLLFALPLLDGNSSLEITGNIESKPYIDLTRGVLSDFGVIWDGESIDGYFPFHSPEKVIVEGDWSNAAFFYVANTLGCNIEISGVHDNSFQGDRAIVPILSSISEVNTIDARDIPDLVPILSVAAASQKGVTFTNIARLRAKESDRVHSVMELLRAFGIAPKCTENTLTVFPGKFHGGTVDAMNDHRIAMAAAIAAVHADSTVTIIGAQCVENLILHFGMNTAD